MRVIDNVGGLLHADAAVEPATLFPLPLAAFEQYMLLDDSEKHPITFFLQFRLKGRLDLTALAEATKEAVIRHPLLCCRVKRISGRYFWVWSPEFVPAVELNPDVWRVTKPWLRSINLDIQTGFRAWGEVTETEAEITLQIHHACCDGIGASQFLEDIAVCYARRTTTDAPLPQLRTLRPELLLTRADPAPRRTGQLPGSLPRRLMKMLRDTIDFLFLERKEILQPMPGTDNDSEAMAFNLESEYLDRHTTRRLRNAASRANVTLNDVLTRDLMKTLDEWNIESARAHRNKLICVLIPCSLRGPIDDQLPAANVLGYAFPVRNRREMADVRTLLTGLGSEMSDFLKAQHGWLFVQGIQMARRIPGLMSVSAMLLRYRCMSTAVLSHMGNRLNAISSRLRTEGDTIHVGNMALAEIRCVPPLRYGTHAAIATYTFSGRLMINLRCDPERFGVTQTRQFLNRYVARLRQTAEEI